MFAGSVAAIGPAAHLTDMSNHRNGNVGSARSHLDRLPRSLFATPPVSHSAVVTATCHTARNQRARFGNTSTTTTVKIWQTIERHRAFIAARTGAGHATACLPATAGTSHR